MIQTHESQVYLRAIFGIRAMSLPLVEEPGVVTFADNNESHVGDFVVAVHNFTSVSQLLQFFCEDRVVLTLRDSVTIN